MLQIPARPLGLDANSAAIPLLTGNVVGGCFHRLGRFKVGLAAQRAQWALHHQPNQPLLQAVGEALGLPLIT